MICQQTGAGGGRPGVAGNARSPDAGGWGVSGDATPAGPAQPSGPQASAVASVLSPPPLRRSDHLQRAAVLPRLLKGGREGLGGLGAGEPEFPVDHEERDAGDAQRATFREVQPDVVGVFVGGEQFVQLGRADPQVQPSEVR